MNHRRDFMKWGIGTTAALAMGSGLHCQTTYGDDQPRNKNGELPEASWNKLPRWYGFNLLEMFMKPNVGAFRKSDFEWMAKWGFNFARLPMDYRAWTDPNDPYAYDEKMLKHIDQAIQWGREYRVHICLCLHRAPGYTVAKPSEKLLLWESDEAQRQFDSQWAMFARRYREFSSRQLSFDLVNEPANVSAEKYAAVVKRVSKAIRAEDPNRLIIADGRQWGGDPVPELIPYQVAQSTRGYAPTQISHYLASWMWNQGKWDEPTWPLKADGKVYNKETLYQERILSWKKLQDQGVGVHVGEWGAYNKTPYDVVIRWMRDQLELWRDAGWGWSLWNLRGSFGIIDSQRKGAKYEPFQGHQLDRQMLELLQEIRA